MSTAIIVDAACDLPVEFFRQNDIFVLPVGIVFGDRRFFDYRDPEMARNFYDDYSHFKAREVFSLPPSVDVVSKFIIEKIAPHFEQALVMCINASHSHLYKYTIEGGKQAISKLKQGGSRDSRLRNLRIMDTRTLFSGQALLAYEALQMVNLVDQISNKALYDVLRGLSGKIKVYTIPDDLFYLRARVSMRGDKSVGSWNYAVGKSVDTKPLILMENGQIKRVGMSNGFLEALRKLFALVRREITGGLMINAVIVSYAGNTRDIMVMDNFRSLQQFADEHGVKVYLTIMGIVAGINVGPGSLSVAYCA